MIIESSTWMDDRTSSPVAAFSGRGVVFPFSQIIQGPSQWLEAPNPITNHISSPESDTRQSSTLASQSSGFRVIWTRSLNNTTSTPHGWHVQLPAARIVAKDEFLQITISFFPFSSSPTLPNYSVHLANIHHA